MREWVFFFATELPLKLRSVVHFYTTVVNTNHALIPPKDSGTHVFVGKLKDMEPPEAKKACQLTR